jgi:ABC-2 type transport system permease protein
MKNTWIVFRKELRSYFASPIAYSIMALYAVIFGFFFYSALKYFQQAAMQSQMMGRGFPMNINEMIVRPVLMNVSVIGLFLIPMICMRLFAEEKRSGTIELLMTSPVRDVELILGKYLAALALYGVILVVSAVNLVFLFAYGKPDWRPILVGFLGLLLQGGCLLAIGTFISTLTRNQIIAGVAGFCVSLLLWVLEWTTAFESSASSRVLAYLSVVTHFESFAKGVLDTKDVVFFLSAIFFGLFLTARSTESLRWRA